MRQYNKDYMKSHTIDWFFKFEGVPCYAPSNGFILPDVISVQTNRKLQETVYSDILKSFHHGSISESPSRVCAQFEWDAYNSSQRPAMTFIDFQDDNTHFSKAFHYVAKKNYCFFSGSIDYVLNNEYRIETPTKEQRLSFVRHFIAMARRGFVCLYPFERHDEQTGCSYMLLGGPYGLSDGQTTFAELFLAYLPEYQLPSYSWSTRLNPKHIDCKERPQVIDKDLFGLKSDIDLFD